MGLKSGPWKRVKGKLVMSVLLHNDFAKPDLAECISRRRYLAGVSCRTHQNPEDCGAAGLRRETGFESSASAVHQP